MEEKVKSAEDVQTSTQTATEEEPVEIEDSKIAKFCKKYGINPNLVMLKITLFVMYGGNCIIVTYLLGLL